MPGLGVEGTIVADGAAGADVAGTCFVTTIAGAGFGAEGLAGAWGWMAGVCVATSMGLFFDRLCWSMVTTTTAINSGASQRMNVANFERL